MAKTTWVLRPLPAAGIQKSITTTSRQIHTRIRLIMVQLDTAWPMRNRIITSTTLAIWAAIPRPMVRIVLSMHITRHRPYKESTLTCHPSYQARLRTRLGPAEGRPVLPLGVSRSGPKDTKPLRDQHLREACTTWSATLEPPIRHQLPITTIPPAILMSL